jgi:hypothetical protein
MWLRYSSLAYLLAQQYRCVSSMMEKHIASFDFCNDEKQFARILLTKKTNFWLFRCHQQRFCGDFFVVDMSAGDQAKRKVYALDLKQGASLKQGGGGAGIQFKCVSEATADLAEVTGIIPPDIVVEKLSGDATALLSFFGVKEV